MNELVKSNLYLIHMDDELYHHGIKGMKWGVRRYQNPDGSLTEEGKKRKRRRLILLGGLLAAGAGAVTLAAIAERNNSPLAAIAERNNSPLAIGTSKKVKRFYGGPGTWWYDPTKAKLKDGRVIDELQPVSPWSKWARSTGRKVKPDYNGKFLSRLNGDTVWTSDPHTVKLKDGRAIDELYPIAPWERAARSTGRKVPKKK